MGSIQTKLVSFKRGLQTISGFKLFAIFVLSLVFYAAYYTFVIPQHFLFRPNVMAQEISLKEQQLSSELRLIFVNTIRKYANQFLLRQEDGADVYSYTFHSEITNTVQHARITPDSVRVQNATVNNGLLEFELRLPAITLAQKEVKLRPLVFCSLLVSETSVTDSQNDLIDCTNIQTGLLNPLTQVDLFYQEQTTEHEPAQLVFSDLDSVMPLARGLGLNKTGHFGRELSHFESMLMLSASVISTSGTMGIEPASAHARTIVALESVTGIFILIWFLAVHLRRP